MSGDPYCEAEDAIIRALFPVNSTVKVAALIGRTATGVAQRADKLGVTKCSTYLATRACRFNGNEPASVASRFKPGQATWNKGVKGSTGLHPNSKRTHFAKGRQPHEARNYQPIGTERVTRDGILERKISDDPSVYPARRWRAVSRLVWEAANGPIPPGHAVVFKPARKTIVADEITLDALELLSRGELMRRNSYHTNYPKEVAQLIQLRGALTRKINTRSNQA